MNTELKGCRSGTQFTPIVHTARSAATDTNKLSFPSRVDYQMPIACDATLWCSAQELHLTTLLLPIMKLLLGLDFEDPSAPGAGRLPF